MFAACVLKYRILWIISRPHSCTDDAELSFDVHISVYWSCAMRTRASVTCCKYCDSKFRSMNFRPDAFWFHCLVVWCATITFCACGVWSVDCHVKTEVKQQPKMAFVNAENAPGQICKRKRKRNNKLNYSISNGWSEVLR